MAQPPPDRFDEEDADLQFDASPGSYGSYSQQGPSSSHSNYGGNYGGMHDDDVERKQREAQRLREELSRAEREAERLAQLKKMEERFRVGRHNTTEALKKSTQTIDREMERIQQVYEQLNESRELLQSHLADLENIRPESWDPSMISERLNDAISTIEKAESNHQKVARHVQQLMGEKADGKLPSFKEPREVGEFTKQVRMGFAFTLPLIVALVVLLLMIRFLF